MTSCALSWGSTSAITSSMPACAAMALAVLRLSPVTITDLQPHLLELPDCLRRRFLENVGYGDGSRNASGRMQRESPSCPARPRAARSSLSRDSGYSIPFSCKVAACCPRRHRFPATVPRIPLPPRVSNDVLSPGSTPISPAFRIIAFARGCWELRSKLARSHINCLSSAPTGRTSVTSG